VAAFDHRDFAGARGGRSGRRSVPKHGVGGANIYKWNAKFDGMDVSEAKRPKTLEDENT
jgi:hypothetical protein